MTRERFERWKTVVMAWVIDCSASTFSGAAVKDAVFDRIWPQDAPLAEAILFFLTFFVVLNVARKLRR